MSIRTVSTSSTKWNGVQIPGKYPLNGDGRTWKNHEKGEKIRDGFGSFRLFENINNAIVNNGPSLPLTHFYLPVSYPRFSSLSLSIIRIVIPNASSNLPSGPKAGCTISWWCRFFQLFPILLFIFLLLPNTPLFRRGSRLASARHSVGSAQLLDDQIYPWEA